MKMTRIGKYLLIGVATAAAVPVVAAVAGPVVKTVVKKGMVAYEKTKIKVAQTMEDMEDLSAEAKAEAVSAQQQKANETTEA